MWLKKTNEDGPLKESQWPPSGQINELCKSITQHRLCKNCVSHLLQFAKDNHGRKIVSARRLISLQVGWVATELKWIPIILAGPGCPGFPQVN